LYDYENAESLDGGETAIAVEGEGLKASSSPKKEEFKIKHIEEEAEPLEVHNVSADSFITVDHNNSYDNENVISQEPNSDLPLEKQEIKIEGE
jgi:hypothetical protein